MKPRIIFIIAAVLLIFISINYYIGWHGKLILSSLFDMHPNAIYWICFWFLAFSYLIARLGMRFMPRSFSHFLKKVGSYWIGIIFYSIVLLPIADLIAGVLQLASIPASTYIPILGIIFILAIGIIFLRGSWNAWNPITRTYQMTIAKEAGGLKDLHIVMASDLHLGSVVGTKHLQLLVDRVNALKPDLILLPGDVIDDDIEPFIRLRMGEIMKQMKAPLGVYAILGNHEYIGGKIKEFVREMKAIDIEVLMDQSVRIADSFYIIGRKDRSAERFGAGGRLEIEALLEEVDRRLPLILMDHQPYHLDKSAASGIDLQLSGHTHRGQMAPNHWITKRLYELDWGYLKKGKMHTVVSSGYGSWGPPIRLGSRSEIIEIKLQFIKP
jgi:predicted MPP superfamily phosphohydrolase